MHGEIILRLPLPLSYQGPMVKGTIAENDNLKI